VEGFAHQVLTGQATGGADLEDGIASVRAMVAIAQSVRQGGRAVWLRDAGGEV
jgi:predicted dehydrogenase